MFRAALGGRVPISQFNNDLTEVDTGTTAYYQTKIRKIEIRARTTLQCELLMHFATEHR
jgi:hypothetical protein